MQKTIQAKASSSASFKLKTLSAAVLSVMLMSQACAAGLGKLTVLSGLGQPLRAEIELTAVSPQEIQSLQPKLASVEAFRQANIEFSPSLQSLRFAIEQRGARQFIRITSVQPISEPFVDILLELNSVNGRLVREYTFLLDPPELRALQPAQIASQPSRPISTSVVQTLPIAPASTVVAKLPNGAGSERMEQVVQSKVAPPTPRPEAASAPGAALRSRAPVATRGNAASTGKQYRVQGGDSLSKIANRNRSQGVSLDQMLVALYRANPEAFINNNMNRLRAGQILAIPSAETSASVDALDAQGLVIAQAADFNDYRNKLAGQVATGTGRKASESRQSAGGKITAKVEESPTPANEALDKLKLSKATPELTAKTAAAQEEKIAQEKAAAEAATRVQDLEKNVNELQRLLEIKSKDLAARQKAAESPTPDVLPATPVPASPTPAASVPPATPVAAISVPASVAPVPAPVSTAAQPVKATPFTPPAPTLAAAPKPATPPAESGILDDPVHHTIVQGGAVLALLLGVLALLRLRRKKQQKAFLDTTMADDALKANSLFGSTGGQTVDTNNSVFNSSFAPNPSNLDSNEVDPVAEADVYIAYGRDAQAEEILKEALRTQPDRHAVRVKLLEIYASRKDISAFGAVATDLHGLTKGEGEDWAQAAALGLSLDPTNSLYAGGEASIANTTPFVSPLAIDESLSKPLNPVLADSPTDLSAASTDVHLDDLEFSPTKKLSPESDTVLPGMAPVEAGLTQELAAEPETTTAPITAPKEAVLPELDASPSTAVTPQDALFAGLNFDFLDTPPATPEQSSTSTPPAEKDLLIEDIVDKEDDQPAIQPDPLEFDLSGISLELPGNAHDLPSTDTDDLVLQSPQPDPSTNNSAGVVQEDFSQLDLSTVVVSDDTTADGIGNYAEMATKLDLAIAYQEIGDQDGARELLDEVLKGGNAEQSEKAKTLLARLA